MITLSKYAKKCGIGYRAAWNRYKSGKIEGAFKDDFGKVLIKEPIKIKPNKVACYARVSSSMNKSNLDSQMNRLISYANAIGLKVDFEIKEVGSGLNDTRKKLLKLFTDATISHIIVEHKDRLTRFGFEYLKLIANLNNTEIIVVNNTSTDRDDLMQDFVSLVTSFCARLYGLRRTKNSVNKILTEIDNDKIVSNKNNKS